MHENSRKYYVCQKKKISIIRQTKKKKKKKTKKQNDKFAKHYFLIYSKYSRFKYRTNIVQHKL